MTAIANLLPAPFAPRYLLPAERAAIVNAATVAKEQLEHPRMPDQLAGVLQKYHPEAAGQVRDLSSSLQLLEGGEAWNITNIAFTSACFAAMQALAPDYASVFRTAWFALSRHRDETGVNAFHPWINRGVQYLQSEGPHVRHTGPASDTLVPNTQRITTSGPVAHTNIPTSDFRRLALATGGPFTAWRQLRYDGKRLSPWPLDQGDQHVATFHFDGVGTWQMQCTRTDACGDDHVTVQILTGAVGSLAEPDAETAASIDRILLARAEAFLAGALACMKNPAWRSEIAALKGTDAWPRSPAARWLDGLLG